MDQFPGELIKQEDREELELAAYKMASAYETERTWYDAIHLVKKDFPNVKLWQLEGMWKAIDAYVDLRT